MHWAHRGRALTGLSLAIVVAIAGMAAGCSSSNRETVSGPARFHSPAPFGGQLPVPEATLSAEDRAWEVYQASKAADWEAAALCYGALTADVRHIPQTADNGELLAELDTTLRDLHDAIHVRDVVSAMNHANNATALTAQLAAPYRTDVPTEARMMAFYARRLEIFVMSGNVGQLRETAVRMGALWQRLRPLVTARGATSLAEEFGVTVAKTINAQQVSDFVPLVAPAQQQVDQIDLLFRTTDEE